ncbi:sigma-54-dependent transcriptional regulator [Rhodoferax sp.]|uniref:sigma-54-dependent transcriptional regulator n=1 Tax=Rhodoferax sp. TaxID=50421 RepID=UPI00275776F0|nr:sigma-54 dependent transcriptional regulator [Rhodoferax sp.]
MTTESLRICLIEDDELMGEALGERFEMEGFLYDWHKTGRSALMALQRRRYSIVVSDIRLPDLSGEDIFSELRQAQVPIPPFLFMTGHSAIDQAVRLLKLGAADYMPKPLDVGALVTRIRELGTTLDPVAPDQCVMGVSAGMRRVEQMLGRLANADGTVLITGESGVGKELVARRLHALGEAGQSKPFVAVNCAAIPETLLEAEMFGFEKGAFTGAVKERRGYFEQADGGTLFLDEVGDMPPVMQVKLLRAIQERTVTRVGSETPIRVNVRLLCATHEDLRQLVIAGRFREDLYYRINVIHLPIPALRERRDDILWLARRFLEEQSVKKGGAPFCLSASAERVLLSHPWPGNVRELKHCLERACILGDHRQIGPEALLGDIAMPTANGCGAGGTLVSHLDVCEKHYIEQALAAHTWRVGESAESLGISRKTLWEKMRKHDIAEPGKPAPS